MAQLYRIAVPLICGMIVLTAGIVIRADDPGFAQIIRERVFDLYQRVDPPVFGPELPIRIIDIDDTSLARHGQWPWPRDLMADMVTTLRDAGAAVIAFDMLFPEPDRTSPQRAVRAWNLPADVQAELQGPLAALPDNDDLFAEALRAAPSVLGVAPSPEGQAYVSKSGLASLGPSTALSLTQAEAVTSNLPIFDAAVQGLGGINVSLRDDDAVVRRLPVLTTVGNTTMPGLFVEALRVAQGAQSLVVRSNPLPSQPEIGIPQDLKVGDLVVPLSADGSYRVRYGTLDPAITLSANDVVAAIDDPASLSPRLAGTVVMVGTSAPGLFDLRATPLGTIVPGVTMHAQAAGNVVLGQHLTRPDWTLGLELVATTIAGLVVIAAAVTLRPLLGALVAVAASGSLIGGSWWAFSDRWMLVDASLPTLTTLLTFGAVAVPILIGTDKRQRFIRDAFAHYLAEPVLERLENNPDALSLDGERRSISVLFMDIRGFTSRSETMEPNEAVNLLNSLLDPLSEAVLAEEGTIDKFMGDGMMTFWNAPLDQPDHAARALRAALAMTDALTAFNKAQPVDREPLAIGIGVHTGEAFVGNMGSRRRFAYSAIGDTVNLAARVEALTGSQGHKVLVTTEALRAATSHDHQLADRFTSAGEHMVKGRKQAVSVHRLKES